jgi:hypothetical protein
MPKRGSAMWQLILGVLIAVAAVCCVSQAEARPHLEFLPVQPGDASPVAQFVDGAEVRPIIIDPIYRGGFAGADEIESAFGTPEYVTVCPEHRALPSMHIVVESYYVADLRAINAMVRQGLLKLYQDCVVKWRERDGITTEDLAVDHVWIFVRNGPDVVRATYGQPILLDDSGPYHIRFSRIVREDNTIASYWYSVWRTLKSLFWLAVVGCIGWGALKILSSWESILRWWYELTPHPAREIVDDAILHGKRIDIDAWSRTFTVAAANDIEREVRASQLRAEAERLRQHQRALEAEAARRQEHARKLAEQRAQAEREVNVGAAAEEALKAAIEHEVAAARAEALRRRKD